ncbi:MAG TPA: phosphate ABC transporter substrate-binding protein PstS [Gammaproteobacteria bacterium]|nr:phosphate ABC transporter substrate-binding protein PstS [Gammaproteobacteria bacterium]
MKFKLLAQLGLLGTLVAAHAATDSKIITGAGATFPYPLYVKWAEAYQKETSVQLNYQPIGSGGGIKQIQANTVDFGASDKPLSSDELKQNNLTQFPTVIGGVVPVINLPGIQSGQVKLSGNVLGDIYLGKIKNWNDPQISALNPGIQLPNTAITVVHRSDGSGTTFLFTDYLSKVNNNWKTQAGADTAVAWPTGIGGKGNEGVASYVQRIKGAIGYVEYAYAQQNKMVSVELKNKDGNLVNPSIDTFAAAAANAKWSSQTNFAEILTDEPGSQSWPIVGATFILMHTSEDNAEKAHDVLKFFDWAYQHGKQMAKDMDYVPLPEPTIDLIHAAWKENLKDQKGNPIWH